MTTAFVAAEVESSAPNANTGKSTSLVFELPATAEAWLTHAARNLTTFSSLATDALKDQSLLRATNFFAWWIGARLDGVPAAKDQALPYPRIGSSSRTGRIFESDELPPDALIAVRLLAEADAAATLTYHEDRQDIKSVAGRSVRVEMSRLTGMPETRYPEAWVYARRLFSPSIRKSTWAA